VAPSRADAVARTTPGCRIVCPVLLLAATGLIIPGAVIVAALILIAVLLRSV